MPTVAQLIEYLQGLHPETVAVLAMEDAVFDQTVAEQPEFVALDQVLADLQRELDELRLKGEET